MATISFTIPDAIVNRVLDGIAYYHGYQDTIFDGTKLIPNPETKLAFARRMIKKSWLDWATNYEANVAAKTTFTATVADGISKITIND
jgi:hypothetical protein